MKCVLPMLGGVAVIGDSLLAGYGAKERSFWPFWNPFNFLEDRGVNAVTGADPGVTSLHSLLGGAGGSTGSRFMSLCNDRCSWPLYRHLKKDGFNMASTGAMASHMKYQIKALTQLVHAEPVNGTLLVVVWMGLNDQCQFCRRPESDLAHYEKYMWEAMEMLKSLGDVVVDLVSLWDLSGLVSLSKTHPQCKYNNKQLFFRNHCKCAFGAANITAYRDSQNAILRRIAAYYGNTGKFKVLYDPSSEDMVLEEMDYSILTQTDCSHPTKETHERLATVLYKNLFLAPDKKLRDQRWAYDKPYLRIECPESVEFQ